MKTVENLDKGSQVHTFKYARTVILAEVLCNDCSNNYIFIIQL